MKLLYVVHLVVSLVHAIQKHNSIHKGSFVCYVDQTVSSCKDLGKCAGFISKQLLCTTYKVANTEGLEMKMDKILFS